MIYELKDLSGMLHLNRGAILGGHAVPVHKLNALRVENRTRGSRGPSFTPLALKLTLRVSRSSSRVLRKIQSRPFQRLFCCCFITLVFTLPPAGPLAMNDSFDISSKIQQVETHLQILYGDMASYLKTIERKLAYISFYHPSTIIHIPHS